MIKKDSVVSLSYTLKNAAGEELDKADAAQPFVYLHGAGQIVPGLESSLEGMKSGDKTDVTVTPDQAYGNVNPQLLMKLERKNFPPDIELQPGMQFSADIGDRQHILTIVTATDEDVQVDANHPLAGETLHFDVEVLDIRDATEEELSHGHAHGADGHAEH